MDEAPVKAGKSQHLCLLLFLYLAVKSNRNFAIMLTSVRLNFYIFIQFLKYFYLFLKTFVFLCVIIILLMYSDDFTYALFDTLSTLFIFSLHNLRRLSFTTEAPSQTRIPTPFRCFWALSLLSFRILIVSDFLKEIFKTFCRRKPKNSCEVVSAHSVAYSWRAVCSKCYAGYSSGESYLSL